jgi:glycosyltransferase involved in cell wall biosynthesis
VARFVDGLASRRTDVVVAVSQSVAEGLERDVVRGRCEIRLILNGVDTELFAPRPAPPALRTGLGIPLDAPILGSIGRLEPIKDYAMMIEAFAALVARNRVPKPPHLLMAGDGSQREALRARVEDLGLAGRVHLLGWRDDVHDLLATFSVFTMSSKSEGTSVSLLEAMSSGCCPVVTRVGGNPDVLGPRLSHRLVESGDSEDMSLKWESALTQPEQTKKDSVAARDRVVECYNVRTMVREYERLYADRPR